jgi:hypothetical protein
VLKITAISPFHISNRLTNLSQDSQHNLANKHACLKAGIDAPAKRDSPSVYLKVDRLEWIIGDKVASLIPVFVF